MTIFHQSLNTYVLIVTSVTSIFLYASVWFESFFTMSLIWHKTKFKREQVDTMLALICSAFFIFLKIFCMNRIWETVDVNILCELLWFGFDATIGVFLFRYSYYKRKMFNKEKCYCMKILSKNVKEINSVEPAPKTS